MFQLNIYISTGRKNHKHLNNSLYVADDEHWVKFQVYLYVEYKDEPIIDDMR
jgi:hypothetical protein